MKNIKFYLRFLIVATALTMVACDDDGDEASAVFPQLQKMECAVGDEILLSFEAGSNWSLTSSALWCTFLVNGEQNYSCSGIAGKQAVTIKVSSDASALMKSYRADLTLLMDGNRQVIFEISRPVTGYELKVFNADQNVEYSSALPYVQDYQGTEMFVVSSNADWVVEPSESLDFSDTQVFGMAGDVVVVHPTLKAGFEHRKDAWKQELRFKNTSGDVVFTLPVHYDGMPDDKIEFSNQNPLGNLIEFSADGFTYKGADGEVDAPMPLSVYARNNQYTVVYVDYVNELNEATWEYEYKCSRMGADESWIFVDDDASGSLTVNMTPNSGQSRNAFLMVFPSAVFKSIEGDFENQVFSAEVGIAEQYSQFVAGHFSQAGNTAHSGGFELFDTEGNPLYDLDGNTLSTVSYNDAIGDMTDQEMIDRFGTTNVSILSLPLGTAYESMVVKPNGFTGYYLQGNPVALWDGVSVEIYSMLETLIMGIGESTNGDQSMEISFLDPEGEVYAVLLIMRY